MSAEADAVKRLASAHCAYRRSLEVVSGPSTDRARGIIYKELCEARAAVIALAEQLFPSGASRATRGLTRKP